MYEMGRKWPWRYRSKDHWETRRRAELPVELVTSVALGAAVGEDRLHVRTCGADSILYKIKVRFVTRYLCEKNG